MEVIAVVGRRAGEIKDTVKTAEGDVVIQFEKGTTVRISSEEIVGQRQGYVLTLTWGSPKNVVLEDCVYLGE